MPKQTLLISLIAILCLIGAAWWLTGKQSGQPPTINPNKIIFFYGPACAECQELEHWLQTENRNNIVAFDSKDITIPAVQAELQQAVSYCRFNDSQGVELPFLFAQGKCYAGVIAVKAFFQQALNS